jgi:hypothetical protein
MAIQPGPGDPGFVPEEPRIMTVHQDPLRAAQLLVERIGEVLDCVGMGGHDDPLVLEVAQDYTEKLLGFIKYLRQ